MTYPGSNRQLNFTVDFAGRTAGVSGSINGGAPTNYASVGTFAPLGSDSSAKLQQRVTENTGFNARLQPLSIKTTNPSGTNMLSLIYNYCADFSDSSYSVTCSSNNGNVTRQQIGFDAINSAAAFAETQTYQYNDIANRLTQASGAPSLTASATWTEANNFDAVGNRWASATGLTLAPDTPSASSWFTAQNRINSWNYDAMGNLTGSLPGRSFIYDGENRQVQAMINNATSIYQYDGDGRRVVSTTPGVTVRTTRLRLRPRLFTTLKGSWRRSTRQRRCAPIWRLRCI